MEEKIDKAIETVLLQVRSNLQPDAALKQTQAVLNLMHAKSQWMSTEQATKGQKPKAN
jgi:hypothetical protein